MDKESLQSSTHDDMSKANEAFDVIIAGGGLSGALTALSIAHLTNVQGQKLRLAIVESTPTTQNIKLTFDDRVLALAHGTAAYLDSIGVWQALLPDATPISDIHISDRGYYGKARIAAESHGVDALGYVIEMSLIGQRLIESISGLDNITWYCPDKIVDISWQKESVSVTLKSDALLTGKLLVGCDGGHSFCRQQANINNSFSEYHQTAVIANVRTAKPHQQVAFERFTESGPIAMLPLTQGRCSLVWSLEPDEAFRVMQLSDAAFSNELTHAFGQWLGNIEEVGKRSSYPLILVQAEEQVFHRMALVGNASHTIHPIAGQGFNLGVRDVQTLARLVKNAVDNDTDIGAYALLNQYANARKVDQNEVISITDSLVSLFSNQYGPLVAGRNIGLKVMNYVSPLQQMFVDKTMGYR